MFKGLQGILHKASNKPVSVVRNDSKLKPIETAAVLLEDKRRQDLIEKFPKQLSLSHENYQDLCASLLTRVAEYMQNLPETRNSYYAQNGGLLEHTLQRTSTALNVLREYFLPDGSEAAQLTQPQTLWAYAIFTASLLHDIGKLVTDFIIEIYDQHHKLIKIWNPFDGAMLTQGTSYDYDFDTSQPDTFKRRCTILLARQLMPAEGFRWIASNKDVLAVWLALLDDDQRGAGTLGIALWRADAQAIKADFDRMPVKEFKAPEAYKLSQMSSTFSPNIPTGDADAKPGEATVAGREMLKWLCQRLGEQSIMNNKSPLFYVPGGLLMNADMFKYFMSDAINADFLRRNPQYRTWQSVRESFIQMGIHENGPGNQATQTFIKTSDNSQMQGVVLNNLNLVLPEQFKVMPPQSAAAIAAELTMAPTAELNQPRTMTATQLASSASLPLEFAKVASASIANQARYIATNGKMIAQPARLAIQQNVTDDGYQTVSPGTRPTGQ